MGTRISYTQGTPNWIDLQSPDVEASKRFYSALFGWNFVSSMLEDSKYWVADLNGLFVAGISGHNPENTPVEVPARWNTYIAADRIDTVLSRVGGAGGTVVTPAFDLPPLGRMAWVADPSGADFGIWQASRRIGARLVKEPGALAWNELVTDNQAVAVPFYEEIFGSVAREAQLGGVRYTYFTVDGVDVAGSTPPLISTALNHWHVYFAVANLDSTLSVAKAQGASVIVASFDLPVGRVAVLRDPQGAFFSIVRPTSAKLATFRHRG